MLKYLAQSLTQILQQSLQIQMVQTQIIYVNGSVGIEDGDSSDAPTVGGVFGQSDGSNINNVESGAKLSLNDNNWASAGFVGGHSNKTEMTNIDVKNYKLDVEEDSGGDYISGSCSEVVHYGAVSYLVRGKYA